MSIAMQSPLDISMRMKVKWHSELLSRNIYISYCFCLGLCNSGVYNWQEWCNMHYLHFTKKDSNSEGAKALKSWVSLRRSNLSEKPILLCDNRLDDTASALLPQEGLRLHRPSRCSHSLFIQFITSGGCWQPWEAVRVSTGAFPKRGDPVYIHDLPLNGWRDGPSVENRQNILKAASFLNNAPSDENNRGTFYAFRNMSAGKKNLSFQTCFWQILLAAQCTAGEANFKTSNTQISFYRATRETTCREARGDKQQAPFLRWVSVDTKSRCEFSHWVRVNANWEGVRRGGGWFLFCEWNILNVKGQWGWKLLTLDKAPSPWQNSKGKTGAEGPDRERPTWSGGNSWM